LTARAGNPDRPRFIPPGLADHLLLQMNVHLVSLSLNHTCLLAKPPSRRMPNHPNLWDLKSLPPGTAIIEHMVDFSPQADRILVAQLTGEARHRARWRSLTGDEEAAAVAGLRELAGGRADLLAEVAGILEGASEGEPDEPLARQAAGLCRKAGADPEAIPGWAEEGRRRRAAVRMPPPSGGRAVQSAGAAGPAARPCVATRRVLDCLWCCVWMLFCSRRDVARAR
jgi:hypothetical protein